MPIFLSKKASTARVREAENARKNRLEILKALSLGQITRRDLYKWGIFTVTGALALKNGLSPFAPSAFADGNIPTGTPRSPLFGAQKFTQRMPRLALQTPIPLTQSGTGLDAVANFPAALNEPAAKRLSYHTDFTNAGGNGNPNNPFRNPVTGRGPMEGRPPGEVFAHQRWNEFFPKVGYIMSIGQIAANTRFHPNFAVQNPNSVWTYGTGHNVRGTLPPFLIKGRYSEPIITRIYQNLPVNRADNQSGFGLNETQLHFHNAHNGAESDGAANTHHFPGTFYDYRWSTTLARRDKIQQSVAIRGPFRAGKHILDSTSHGGSAGPVNQRNLPRISTARAVALAGRLQLLHRRHGGRRDRHNGRQQARFSGRKRWAGGPAGNDNVSKIGRPTSNRGRSGCRAAKSPSPTPAVNAGYNCHDTVRATLPSIG